MNPRKLMLYILSQFPNTGIKIMIELLKAAINSSAVSELFELQTNNAMRLKPSIQEDVVDEAFEAITAFINATIENSNSSVTEKSQKKDLNHRVANLIKCSLKKELREKEQLIVY